MTTYRLMDGSSGRPGNGPSAATSYQGDYLAGTVFQVTAGDFWFEGFWWWVCNSGQQTYVFGNRVAGSKLNRVYQGKREPDHRTSE